MEQIKFILLSNTIRSFGGTIQSVNGVVECRLRNGIKTSHNYHKNNLMLLIFEDTDEAFIIPSENELKNIYNMHIQYKDLMEPLHEYALKTFKKVKL